MDIVKLRALISGILTYVPRFKPVMKTRGDEMKNSARYCYAVYLRHLVMAYSNKLPTMPKVIAELGPGDSFGIGLAALLTAADKYYAFDIVRHIDTGRSIKVLRELVDLFNNQNNIPDETEFPKVKPYLESYGFPKHILSDERMKEALRLERIESIKTALLGLGNNTDSCIAYFAPWSNANVIKEESVDMVFSQAVMEHVDDLEDTYRKLYRWLKPGGFLSLQIDFKSHGKAKEWNGHWAYNDLTWRLIRGRSPYVINREPHSVHIRFLKKAGFEIVCNEKVRDLSGIQKKELAPSFEGMADDDLVTSGAFIQALRPRQ